MTGTVPPAAVAGLRRLPGHPAAFFGTGAAARLNAVLAAAGARRVLLVHGPSYATGPAARLTRPGRAGYEVHHFGDVRPNPELGHIEEAVRVIRQLRPDAVVGIGGGSSMDVAKAASVLAAQDADPADCLGTPDLVCRERPGRLVLVPTTAGSGSELTRFATLYRDGRKLSLDTAGARADVVLVDPELTATVPVPTTVAGALDAFSQAVESSWARAATPQSLEWAEEALHTLLPALRQLADTGRPAEVRHDLSLGAALAGAAIDVTRTTAAHALSYALTSRLGLPHGVAVALHLRWLIGRHAAATSRECPSPGVRVLHGRVAEIRRTVRAHTGREPEELLADLLQAGGHPADLADLALPAGDWADVVAEALHSGRAMNNPCTLTPEDVLGRFVRPSLTEGASR